MTKDKPLQTAPRSPRTKETPAVELGLTVSREAMTSYFSELSRVVRDCVREELRAGLKEVGSANTPPAVPDPPKPLARGVDLRPDEQTKAKDLRLQLLLGKLPEDGSLLIDTDTTAKLLGISRRALERMVAGGSILMPIRISGRIPRWRLAELLEWIEVGCPHPNHWTYGPATGRQVKGRK